MPRIIIRNMIWRPLLSIMVTMVVVKWVHLVSISTSITSFVVIVWLLMIWYLGRLLLM